MIKGIGVDIIEIERIKKSAQNKKFLERCYTHTELDMFISEDFTNYNSLAGNFAGKESVAKVFGTGFRNFEFKDIEILRDDLGKPYVKLYGNAQKIADEMCISEILISISHDKDKAIAYSIGQ